VYINDLYILEMIMCVISYREKLTALLHTPYDDDDDDVQWFNVHLKVD